jgi:hypothetical protein
MDELCGMYEGEGNSVYVLVVKPAAKSQPGRPTGRWEDIKMNLKEAELESEEWIYLAQKCDKFACCCECGNELPASIK